MPTASWPRKSSPMGRSKRASMREGPLADLFRSTEESVREDEVRVTAAKEEVNSRVEVAVTEAEVEPEVVQAPEKAEAPPVEEPKIVSKPKKHELELEPAKDPKVEEIEKRDRKSVV